MSRNYYFLKVTLFVSILSLFCSCTVTSKKNPILEKSPTPKPAGFRVVGYVTDAAVPVVIPYDKLTHINYAFLIPNEDGSFQDLANNWKIGELVRLAHSHNVNVLISVGGAGWDKQFTQLAANPDTRTAFIGNLVKTIEEYHFDGVDIDWEFPDPGASSQNFLLLMEELRLILPKNSLLTAAVAALGQNASGIPTESFGWMDYVNIMAYDDSGPRHSSMDFAQSALDYWLGRGLPPEKAVLGVPFYARPIGIPYSRIVQADPAAAQIDSTIYAGMLVNYNGIPTIQEKTRLALQRASGIMFWTLENDASGDLSLLTAIHKVVVDSGK